jgi:5-methylcytosine-specific restriction endonuclease McrA
MSKALDITNQKFGRLTAIEKVPRPQHLANKFTYWRCKCECGSEGFYPATGLNKGKVKSCGCITKDLLRAKAKDMTGMSFGKLLVLQRSADVSKRGVRWLCRCECGSLKVINGTTLRGGQQSCGCLSKETARIQSTKYGGNVARNCLVSNYRTTAAERSLEFALSHDECDTLFTGACVYCGDLPNRVFTVKKHSFIYNGIDRVDNSRGYVIDNVVACCQICNRAKNSLDLKDFEQWIDRLTRFRINRAEP